MRRQHPIAAWQIDDVENVPGGLPIVHTAPGAAVSCSELDAGSVESLRLVETWIDQPFDTNLLGDAAPLLGLTFGDPAHY